jgi:zinc transport system ATP-binding protein
MSQILCNDLSLGYDGKLICEHLTFSVNAGDCLCIVGDNGSGKSTLMKTLLRLKAPMAGELRLGDDLRQSDIGYLPQQNEAQKDFPASVWEVVLSGCVSRGEFRFFPSRKNKRQALAWMKCLGITELKHRPFRSLSGGQQQRCLLARALCSAEKILLLDEPTAGLDPQATEEMYRTIQHLNQFHRVTILMITHDISSVTELGTAVLHMSKHPVFYPSVEAYCQSCDFPHKTEVDHEN